MYSASLRSHILRIHLLCVLVPLFILTTAYKGSYFSLLFKPILMKPMETWEEVLESDLKVSKSCIQKDLKLI